jgi:hypothetical protein
MQLTHAGHTRAGLHCHSAGSRVPALGVQRAVGLPECATPPQEVYALAKRRGMDFVTITDHGTIAGVLSIADREDVFVSVELTARERLAQAALDGVAERTSDRALERLGAASGQLLTDAQPGQVGRAA